MIWKSVIRFLSDQLVRQTYLITHRRCNSKNLKKTLNFITEYVQKKRSKRMKIIKKNVIASLIMLLCLGIMKIPVFAASTSQDGLEVKLVADKAIYVKGDQIIVTLSVANTNQYNVTNVSLENIVPKGYKLLNESSATKFVDSIKAGEVITLTVTYVEDKLNVGNNKPGIGENGDKLGIGDSISVENEGNSNPTNISISSSSVESKNVNSVNSSPMTGDTSNILLWVMVLCVSSIAGIKTLKKKSRGIFWVVFLFFVISGNLISASTLQIKAAERKYISVSQNVSIDNKEISLEGIVMYDGISEDPKMDDDTITRGEWISLLLDKLGYSVNDSIDMYYYLDTAGTKFGSAIESALQYGIIPMTDEQDVPSFKASEATTREFAAVTAVNAMGYTNRDILSQFCTDIDLIEYPMQSEIAVSEGMLNLDNGNFNPKKFLTQSEMKTIFNALDRINESSKMGDNIYEDIEYADGVLVDELKDVEYILSRNADGTYTIQLPNNDITKQIIQDTAIVLPESENCSAIALIVNSVSISGNMLEINARVPDDPSQVLSSLKFEGCATAVDAKNIEMLVNDIEFSYDPNEVQSRMQIGGSLTIPGKFTLKLPEDGLKINEHIKLFGKAETSIPNITAKADIDFNWLDTKITEVALAISEKVKVEGGFQAKVESSTDITHENGKMETVTGIIEVARVPVSFGVPGMSADVIIGLAYSASGKIEVVYTLNATQGIEYKNGNFRNLCSVSHDFQPINVQASGKIGGTLGVNLCVLKTIDLIGFDAQIGPAIDASLELHLLENPILICADVSSYMYASWEMNPDTMVAAFLKNVCHYTLSGDIWDKEKSPYKWLGLHFENGNKVDDCTFGKGNITGYVFSAEDGSPLKDARIIVHKYDNKQKIVYTDEKGKYTIEGLSTGTYTLTASANKYQTYVIDNINVQKSITTNVETIKMISRENVEDSVVSGNFLDATTGNLIDNIKYEVRKGWNRPNGELVKTGMADKQYTVTLAPGNYTIIVSKDGYITNSENITATEGAVMERNVTLLPSGGSTESKEMRIVLTWGREPSDLDSHLFGSAMGSSEFFHTFYSNKEYYFNNEFIAGLDLDDTTSYGPETTTIKKKSSGTYSYYVHDYSNKGSSNSTALSMSGAKVKVYKGQELVLSMSVPVNQEGTVWHVFDYDVATDTIVPSDQMTYSDDPGSLGRRDSLNRSNEKLSEEEAVRIISECEEKTDSMLQSEEKINTVDNISSTENENEEPVGNSLLEN